MQPKFRLYRRSSRANGTYYAQDCATGARESLGAKILEEAEKLLRAKNESHAHPKAGVSTNVQLRIVHNRALDLEWILRPVLSKRAWPKIKYGQRGGITRAQHEAVLAVTPNKEYGLFFQLCWLTGGSQSDIASLQASDVDWNARRLYYARQKLKSRGLGNACLVIGAALEAVLKELPSDGPLFPNLCNLKECRRSNYFHTRRVKAGLGRGMPEFFPAASADLHPGMPSGSWETAWRIP